KAARVFKTMDRVGLNLVQFLNAVFYGDNECTSDSSMTQRRRHFYASPLLPKVLSNMCRPTHRTATRRGKNFRGPSQFLRQFAFSVVVEELNKELRRYESHLPTGAQPINKDALLSITMDSILEGFTTWTPRFVRLLRELMASRNIKRRIGAFQETHSRNMISLVCSMLVFSPSNRQNQLQRKLGLYLKAKGTPVPVFDFLQSVGITMSYRWSLDAVYTLADSAMVELRIWVGEKPFAVDMDNVLLSYGVTSQRVLNRSQTINATACTVIKLPCQVLKVLMTHGEVLRSLRLRMRHARDPRGSRSEEMARLTFDDLMDAAAQKRFAKQHIHHILRALLDSAPFRDFACREDTAFAPPPPVRQLPTGPEHRTEYFMLQTEPIDETSYDGALGCVTAFMKQMGLDTPEAQARYGVERGIPWGGDGLTTARLRMLQRFRVDAPNGWDRLDWMILFGCLFHQLWWILIDIHHNHYGTDLGNGLGREINALGRTGMAFSNKKPDFHTLDEMVTQFWTASTLDCWLWVSGCDTMKELRRWADSQAPAALCTFAETIYTQRQSTRALHDLAAKRRRNPFAFDDCLKHRIVANRDMGFYVTLRRSIKQGDIGIYRDALPQMLAFYKGGGNTNYTRETAETMQILFKEMTPELRDIVLDHCLLVNISGQPNRFIPTGQLQEHNNDKVKNNHSTHAPGSSMELTRRMSPALPVLDSICKHVDSSFTDLYHGATHTPPNADLDIAKMVSRFHEGGVHSFQARRKVE
ncbi:hypothetical protein AURDEDRAFT_36198, partial [Auricularia subglabra TFB-10046 SS5]